MIAAAALLTSCAKEKAVGSAEGELIEYTLQAEVAGTGAGLDIDTKVALNSDGITPNWESGDQILVLDAAYKPVGADGLFTLSSGQGMAYGKFTGTVYAGQKPTYAIYPATAATVSGDAAVTAGTLAVPTGDDAGSIKGAVMLGNSSDGKFFTFTNTCAVLKINTGDYGKSGSTDPAIKSVKVSASYGDTATPVAGAFSIDWTTTPPTITATGPSTENELTVTLPSALQTNDKDIYIPILPLPMQSSTAPSMKYVFTNTDNISEEVSYDFSAAITAGTLKDLGKAQNMKFQPERPDLAEIQVEFNDLKIYDSGYGGTYTSMYWSVNGGSLTQGSCYGDSWNISLEGLDIAKGQQYTLYLKFYDEQGNTYASSYELRNGLGTITDFYYSGYDIIDDHVVCHFGYEGTFFDEVNYWDGKISLTNEEKSCSYELHFGYESLLELHISKVSIDLGCGGIDKSYLLGTQNSFLQPQQYYEINGCTITISSDKYSLDGFCAKITSLPRVGEITVDWGISEDEIKITWNPVEGANNYYVFASQLDSYMPISPNAFKREIIVTDCTCLMSWKRIASMYTNIKIIARKLDSEGKILAESDPSNYTIKSPQTTYSPL